MSAHPLEELLRPRSIAVVGASKSGRGGGFVAPLLELGFKGDIYPVNPKYTEIMGMKAYPRVRDIPGPVDYVISSIPAAGVLGLLDDCAEKGVKLVHLFTARFSETGRKDAAQLEQDILRKAREGGIRLIGPNCMGIYYPAMGISFNGGMPGEAGSVGVVSQSGQVVGEMVGSAGARGIRFSKAISYGNALDFNECDYLEYFAQDPETKVVLLYIEGVRDGPRFLRVLRELTAIKPVIVVKGGRGQAGTRATASHTASLAGSREIWQTVVNQTGIITARDLEELVDIAVAFYFLPPFCGRRVGVTGGGGGKSVLAADLCEEAGLNVIPLPDDIRQELKRQGSPIWDWINNPADFSITMGDNSSSSVMTELMAGHPDFDMMMLFISGPWHMDKAFSLDKHMESFGLENLNGKPSILVFGERDHGSNGKAAGYEEINTEMKRRLNKAGYPLYPGIQRAANAVDKMISYYERRR